MNVYYATKGIPQGRTTVPKLVRCCIDPEPCTYHKGRLNGIEALLDYLDIEHVDVAIANIIRYGQPTTPSLRDFA